MGFTFHILSTQKPGSEFCYRTDATALFLCSPLEKAATSSSNSTSFTNVPIRILPVRYRLTGVLPERSFQYAELEVVNTNIDSKSGKDDNAFFQFFLIVQWIYPQLVHVSRSITNVLHTHKCHVINKRKIPADIFRQPCKSGNGQRVQYHAYFSLDPMARELM